MKKNFQSWHREKSKLHEEKARPFFHEREVWFASVGANIGFEQDGRGSRFLRPVVVLKKFNNEVLWCMPLTKTLKAGKYYFLLHFDPTQPSTAILSQLRLIDSKRLQYKVGDISAEEFANLKQKIKQLLA